MRGIWRFYVDAYARWRWQRLSVNKVVTAKSTVGFADYEQCVDDARSKGYLLQSNQAKLQPTRGERSLVGTSYNLTLATAENRHVSEVHTPAGNPSVL